MQELYKDFVFSIRYREYMRWFLDYLEIELEKNDIKLEFEWVWKLMQLIQFDEMEKYLFYKYPKQFVRFLFKLLKDREDD